MDNLRKEIIQPGETSENKFCNSLNDPLIYLLKITIEGPELELIDFDELLDIFNKDSVGLEVLHRHTTRAQMS